MTKVLMVDMDGVLYNWHNAVYDFMRTYRNYTDTFETLWSKDFLNFTPEFWEFIVNTDIFYSSQMPTNDCLEFLNSVKDKFTVYYVTGRPDYVRLTTEQFLRRYKFPFQENLIFSKDKVNTARLIRADYCLEDLPKYLEDLSKVSTVIMREQPYNVHLKDKYKSAQTLMGMLKLIMPRTETDIMKELGYEAG